MFFQQYMKYTETKKLKIDFDDYTANTGFTFRKTKKLYHANEIPNIPHMIININQQLLFQEPDESPQAVTEYKDILKYIGSHLHILELRRDVATGSGSFDANLVDMVLDTCPNLRDLCVNHNRYLDCCDMGKGSHTGIQFTRFGEGNTYENGFFNALSSRLPNLKYMSLEIRMQSNYLKFDNINMPSTKFTELNLDIVDYRQLLEFDDIYKETQAIRITTKDDNLDRYYYCCISFGMFIDDLKLMYMCEYSSNDNNKYNVVQPAPESYVHVHIVCSSMETFTLGKSPNMKCAVRL